MATALVTLSRLGRRVSFAGVVGATDTGRFIVESLDKPDGFCGWAWDDIHKYFLTLRCGGSFQPWMKAEDNIIACCTDGIRPVVFNLERIED